MKSEDIFEPFIEEDEFSVLKKEKKEIKIQKNEFSELEIIELKKTRNEKIEKRIELSKQLNKEELFISSQNQRINLIEKNLNSKEIIELDSLNLKTFDISLEDLSLRYNKSIPPFIEIITNYLLNFGLLSLKTFFLTFYYYLCRTN